MIDILHTILTDADARKSAVVEAHLLQTSIAGTPWYNVE